MVVLEPLGTRAAAEVVQAKGCLDQVVVVDEVVLAKQVVRPWKVGVASVVQVGSSSMEA